MSFFPVEYLKEGKTDFLGKLSQIDRSILIENIKSRPDHEVIINSFLRSILDTYPSFCFDLIHDLPYFPDETTYLIDKYIYYKTLSADVIEGFLKGNPNSAKKYLPKYFDDTIEKLSKNPGFLVDYLLANDDLELLRQRFAYHPNVHYRFLFMNSIITNHSELLKTYYDDITKYLTSYTYAPNEQYSLFTEKMSAEDVSLLAYNIFKANLNDGTWERMRDYVIENYDSNSLARYLLEPKRKEINSYSYGLETDQEGVDEFCAHPDIYFSTSSDYRYYIARNYPELISQDVLEKYEQFKALFCRNDKIDPTYHKVELYSLGKKLEEYADKYLSLSRTAEHGFIASGSTASCYRVGDYVFKLDGMKWSYEDVLCPNLYIILPNLEEVFLRDENGIVKVGIEVQRYLKRGIDEIPEDCLPGLTQNFTAELSRLGYRSTDTLVYGTCGDNCRLLDSYEEAGNPNAPDWFKEYPLVLVDRDRIYQKTNRYPKQLR